MTTPAPTTYPRLPIPGGWQLTINIDDGGQPSAVVLGGRLHEGGTPNVTTGRAWRDAFWLRFRGAMTLATVQTGATLRSVDGTGQVIELGAQAGATGQATGARAVAAASTLIKWQTAQGGRSGKGRTFLPGLPVSYLASTGRGYSSSAQTDVPLMITNYLTDGASLAFRPAVLSFRKGLSYDLTAGSLAPVVGIQRRRMRA